MNFEELNRKESHAPNEDLSKKLDKEELLKKLDEKELSKKFDKMENLISNLRTKKLPEDTITFINSKIREVNENTQSGAQLGKLLDQKQREILTHFEKQLKFVPKGHYRNQWMVLGMSAFGLPFGVVFGTALDNMGFIGLGLPIGLAIGLAMGAGMDETAKKEGRQLDLD